MDKRSKQNRIKYKKVKQGKIVKVKEKADSPGKSAYPSFSFYYLKEPYHICNCEDCDKIALLNQMDLLCQITWNQIYSSGKHGLGTEKISRSAIKTNIPHEITEDVSFFALRFSGKKPMIGFREQSIFYILFLDYDFSVYDHGN